MTTLSLITSDAKRGQRHPALYVGLCGDAPHDKPCRVSLANTTSVVIERGSELSVSRGREDGVNVVSLQINDARLSSRHARLMRFGGAWGIEDLGSKNGTFVAGVRTQRRQLSDDALIMVGHTALVFRDAGGELGDHIGWPDAADPGLATFSPLVKARFDEITAAARSSVAVELTGESGTGKELAARAVHALSGRTGRFVAVNCGALAANLVEAELFGHKKGAYTGAHDDRLGFVRAADGGTLFLDEIAELPLQAQAALLRVLQEREVVPVGGERPINVDLRLVTATLRNLDEEVVARRFREDLRARLLGVQIALPPLRDRREDLGWLISTVLKRVIGERELTFAADVVSMLYQYDWPLNIRELERALTAASVGPKVQVQDLPRRMRETAPPASERVVQLSSQDAALKARLANAISVHDGNLSAVARELGRDRKQIQRWVKRFGLSRDG